jgi:UDP-glucose 4-epimerase
VKVLVLGGNGFIGSHVVDALVIMGHKVRVFDRADDRYRTRLEGVEYVLGSFEDVFLIAEALADIDVVFHGISTTVPSTSNLDPVGDVQSNLLATLRLLKAMLDKGIHRIVFLSSGGTVYGRPTLDPIPENHSLHPVCSYGIVKVAIENYLFMYQELYGLKPVILRASNPYGERQGHLGVQGVIGTFLNKTLNNERVEIWGDGSVVRDFIYVGDLAQMCLKAIESEIYGVFNVGSGEGISVSEVLECIVSVSGVSLQVEYKPARDFDIARVVLDITNTQKIFNWMPVIGLHHGIKRTWQWMNSDLSGMRRG